MGAVKSHRAWTLAAVLALVVVAVGLYASLRGDSGEASEALSAEPTAGEWRPWVLDSGSAIRVPPPPVEGSPAAKRDAEELRAAVEGRDGVDERRARKLEQRSAVEPWLRDVMGFVAARAKDPTRRRR